MLNQFDEIEVKDGDFPDTLFIRDIEGRVFQAIAIKCISTIEGVALLDESNMFDNILGREGLERIKGIYIEQDPKNCSINIKIELNICYGISIPKKSEEIQIKLVKEIAKLTGLHVACVHIVFKNLLYDKELEEIIGKYREKNIENTENLKTDYYSEEF